MAQKYTALASTATADRLISDKAFTQLSDGTPVWLDYDGTTVYLAYGGGHSSRTTIASLSGFYVSGNPQNMMLVRDASDNLYVIGTASTAGTAIRIQAFTKTAGVLNWAPQTAANGGVLFATASDCVGAAWCNTGGGTGSAGHVVAVFATANSIGGGHVIFDAGAALAGTLTITASSNTPTSFWGGSSSLSGVSGNAAFMPNGFGAANGIYVNAASTSQIHMGAWAVGSFGTLTTNLSSGNTWSVGASMSSSTKIKGVWLGTNNWAVVVPIGTAGQYTVAMFSTSTLSSGWTNSPTLSNMAVNCGWDVYLDPLVNNRIWVVGLGPVSANQRPIYQASVDMSVGGNTWAASSTLLETLTGIANTDTTNHMRMVQQPVGQVFDYHVWGLDSGGTNYELLGDYIGSVGNPIYMIV